MTTASGPTIIPGLSLVPRRPELLERLGRKLVHAVLPRIRHGRLELVDGASRLVAGTGEGGPSVTLHVRDPRFYSALAFRGSVGAGESYMDGLWQCDDLAGLIELLVSNAPARQAVEGPLTRLLSPLVRLAAWKTRNTRDGSRRNIISHYDLGDDFFALFLDPTMTYSCAIFEDPSWSLERAQVEKIDRACRKLELKPTDHLLEIGTGWGALAMHAARVYGCRVTTTTISNRQHAYATRAVREAGLADRVTILLKDYRDLPSLGNGSFDKLVSIEMVEAVGDEFLDTYFHTCAGLLKDNGQMLLQSIVIRDQYYEAARRDIDWLKAYIFPGSCLPSVERISRALTGATDLRVWHLEDLGPHYATTLRMWRDRFMARLDEVRAMGFPETFIRMWEFYLAYCEGTFAARHVGDVQLLLTKPRCRRPVAVAPRPA